MSDLVYDSLGGLFDDPQNAHGDCENPFLYVWPEQQQQETGNEDDDKKKEIYLNNPLSKDIELTLANSEPDLMAHHVWEAAIQLSNLIVNGKIDVKGKYVIELGAGAALPAIISALASAKLVLATDYDSKPIVDNMIKNIEKNIKEYNNIRSLGVTWGVTPAEKIFELSENERFDCILLADTLWLGDQHVALLDMINDIINEETGIIYLTYQHHNEHAPSFFELATTNVKYNYEIIDTVKIPWGGRTLEDFVELENDEEMYGPVLFTSMRKRTQNNY